MSDPVKRMRQEANALADAVRYLGSSTNQAMISKEWLSVLISLLNESASAHDQLAALEANHRERILLLAEQRDSFERDSQQYLGEWRKAEAQLAAAQTRIGELDAGWTLCERLRREYADKSRERIAELEAALRDIAVGLLPEDRAAGDDNMYMLCASRLCGIARKALASFGGNPT